MNSKSLKVKIFSNFLGTYKEVRQVADITTSLELQKTESNNISNQQLKRCYSDVIRHYGT